MIEERKAQFEQILQARKEELLQWLREHERELDELQADMPADDKDAAPWQQRQAELRGRIEEERAELELLEQAFERLGNDEYGYCVECGDEIPVRRLEVLPLTPYCTRCQELLEG